MEIDAKALLPHVFDRPIAFHRILAEVAGSVNGGVFLSQAMYWSGVKSTSDGWFYKTAEDWEKETFLSRREQETVRRNLIQIGVLQEKRAGIPAKMYFRVKSEELLKKLMEIAQTRMSETDELAATKETICSGGTSRSITENTTETTAQTTKTHGLVEGEFDEFWAAYPKRSPHSNPKHPAKLKYVNARTRLNVSHETLMEAVRGYAAAVAGKNPEMIAQAVTWLNQRRWEEDYAPQPAQDTGASMVEQEENLNAIIFKYPGPVSDKAEAKRILAAELAKGTQLGAIVEAAQKYACHA